MHGFWRSRNITGMEGMGYCSLMVYCGLNTGPFIMMIGRCHGPELKFLSDISARISAMDWVYRTSSPLQRG